MLFARAMAMACLTVMRALCWFTAALLVLLTVLQFVRGDIDARPYVTMLSALAFAGIGLASGWGAHRFEQRAE
ncbi:MAG: hypothetical protein HEQ16_10115 [Bosea sp.]|jgi:hypothetical protein|nr:hypothetical protein [Bosea sp. (in: a-proteobacteria)]